MVVLPSVALARNMGRKQAMEMLLTGDFIDAAEAQRRGLVNRVVPLDQLDAEVKQLTDSICGKSAAAVSMGKQAFYRQLELGLERITIAPASPLVGQTLREARLRHATGALLVGLVHPGAGLRFNPSGDERFQAGDEILIMGPADALETLTRLAEGKV